MVAPRLLLLLVLIAAFCALGHGQSPEDESQDAPSVNSKSANYSLPLSTNTTLVPFDVVNRYMSLIPSADTAFFARNVAGDILLGFTTIDPSFASDSNFAVVSSDISRPSFRTCGPPGSQSQAYLACDIAPASGALKDAAVAEATKFAASFPLSASEPSLTVACDTLPATSFTFAPGQSGGSRLSIVNCRVQMPQALSHATPPTDRTDITVTFVCEWAPPVGSSYTSIASVRLSNIRRGAAGAGLWKMPAIAVPRCVLLLCIHHLCIHEYVHPCFHMYIFFCFLLRPSITKS